MELPKCIGVVGSRSFTKHLTGKIKVARYVKMFISNCQEGTEIVSGGAIGVDRWAARFGHESGHNVIEYFPEPDIPYIKACFARNKTIVNHIKDRQGMLVAFVDKDSWRGTSDTVKYALSVNVPVRLFVFTYSGNFVKEVDDVLEYVREYRSQPRVI